ncbi:DUF262 domain-containing protein [Cupriavidus taiwanensis]|uniref:DUF262 domain-containing protein n=1 Tax=Cupriavidus taiwanensis TaxID=164546 RepID=UPI001572A2BE|nr:DUF262 domain-containing protein [Cupriavidus taiwanensis]NSX16072.1 DUF262 domain-containing protein [Cupriavidus taiwanensis]
MDFQSDIDEIDLSGIAQYLSDLSQEGPLPHDVEPLSGAAPFRTDDISFDDNDWLRRVVTVQSWLCLDRPISSELPAPDAAILLMEQISPDPADSCLAVDAEVVTLSELGAQHLDTWLSRSVAHREAFQEALEEERSLRDASEEWRLLWEESSSLARQPASIKAEVKTLTIRNFADYAKDEDLELNPSYQRDSVWSTGDSQLLIDSILRGIPIPSIILTQVEGDDKLQIVDGKQRLTAILRFIGQHPTARAYARSVDSEDEFDRDHKKFIRKRHLRSREISEHYLPFRTRRYLPGDPLHKISGRYYCEIRDEEIAVGQGKAKVREIFEKAHSRYLIPVIVYENTRLQDIHHVFSIYNKQGKKLNAEELRNATFHHLGLTKLLLVLSGDRPYSEDLAAYLPADVKSGIDEVGEALRDRGFGTLRFKRTKVLSWVCALMLHQPNRSRDDSFVTPSTASHIDSFLRAISDRQGSHPLFQNTVLVSLARDIKAAVRLHADAEDAWSPRFRSKKGHASSWEELPLVASLLVTFILAATGASERLLGRIGEVRRLTEASPGPAKSQNKTQWEYISKVSLGVLRTLEIDEAAAAAALEKRYGYSCIEVLQALTNSAGAQVG